MRDKIRTVMRYAGPRMIFYHPVLAIKHLLRKKPKYKLAELLGGITENKLHEEQSSVPPVGKEEW
jgi:antitoxin component of MazEF toxin-antitoxin module